MRVLTVRGAALALALALAAAPAGCGGPNIGDGDFRCGAAPPECPPGFACAADGWCRRSSAGADAAPDDGPVPDGGGPVFDAGPPDANLCGNDVQDSGEECDDGNLIDGDGCDSNCTLPTCGNGIETVGEICYTVATPLATGVETTSVALGDLNGDTVDDIVTTDRSRDYVVYRLSSPGSGFPTVIEIPCADGPTSVALRDFNEDTHLDVVAGNQLNDSAFVFVGDGTGSLGYSLTITLPSGGAPVGVAIFENDGERDIAVLLQTPAVYTYNNNGGLFNPGPSFVAPATPRAFAHGQLDGTGGEDLIAVGDQADEVVVYLSDGLGGFTPSMPYSIADGSRGLAVVDVEPDLDLDLVVASVTGGAVTLLINDGSGGFTFGDVYFLAIQPKGVAALDADGDGLSDLAVAGTDGRVELLINQGGSDFDPGGGFDVPVGAAAIAAGNLNDDGIDDLAVAGGAAGGTVTLILSNP